MSWFTQLRLATKLTLAFLAVALVALIIGGFGTMKLKQVDGMMSSLYAIEAEKLGEARTQLGGNPNPFVIEDIQHDPAPSRGQFRTMPHVDSTLFGH